MAQSTSNLWKELWSDPNTRREFYFEIAGKRYGEEDEISHVVYAQLFDKFSIGNATCAELNLTLLKNDLSEIPKGAKIIRYVKLSGGGQESEPIKKGEFFISRRKWDGYKWKLQAYDAMRRADNYWKPSDDLVFPMSMPQAVDVICEIMGIKQDPRNELNESYTIDYPDDHTTMRDILGWIAAAHGGNFHISDKGELRLVKLSTVKDYLSLLVNEHDDTLSFGEGETRILLEDPSSAVATDKNQHVVGQDITDGKDNGIWAPISRITLQVSDEEVYTAGTDDGVEIVGICPYATQAMCDDILNGIKGFRYQMFEASAANIDLSYELGDGIYVDDIISFIARYDDDGSGYVDVSAPGEEETVEEYPALQTTPQQRATNRKIAQTRSYIEKSNKEITQTIEDLETETGTMIKQTLDSITLQVGKTTSDGTKSYADITLTVDGEEKTGRVNILGDTEIDGNLVANALYAVSAYFNSLTSSKLDTSNTISRYLNKDTSDFTSLRASESGFEVIEFRCSKDGASEQAKDEQGNALYWGKSIENASILYGWPYDQDRHRIFLTTENTGYPVFVYKYAERVGFKIFYEDLTSSELPDIAGKYYAPRIAFSMINPTAENGYSQGVLRKDTGSINLYEKVWGDPVGIFAGEQTENDMPDLNSGEKTVIVKGDPVVLLGGEVRVEGDSVRIEGNSVSIDGMRTPVELYLATFSNGAFYIEYSDGSFDNFTVSFDANNRPVAVNNTITGKSMHITW